MSTDAKLGKVLQKSKKENRKNKSSENMGILKHIREDIRRGENIDLFVTVIVATGLVVLNLIGVAPQTWIAPLNLAILGLLAIAMLGNRYKVEEVLKNLNQESSSLFQEKFSSELESNFEKSKELWLVGITLGRTIKTYYSLLERKLARGDHVRVLLVDPNGVGCEMAEMRVYGRPNVERNRAEIRGNLGDFCDLAKVTPDKLEIRTINYPLGFGGFAIDPDTASGILYLEHYPFKTAGGSMPKFVLRARDGRWYDFFKEEMRTLWENGEVWDCELSNYEVKSKQLVETTA
jgi:hypothetical protein